ncbi:hypothetical protein ACJX0J_031601, partial [Zea mays]
ETDSSRAPPAPVPPPSRARPRPRRLLFPERRAASSSPSVAPPPWTTPQSSQSMLKPTLNCTSVHVNLFLLLIHGRIHDNCQ